jgi:hypothetical protein
VPRVRLPKRRLWTWAPVPSDVAMALKPEDP